MFSVIRGIIDLFYHADDSQLGLYGAFSYDLAFQFEPLRQKHTRLGSHRDVVLYIPDRIVVVDQNRTQSWVYEYDFEIGQKSTTGLPRTGAVKQFEGINDPDQVPQDDHRPGEYAAKVRNAKKKFKQGDLFEAVLSQTFYRSCTQPPSQLHRRLLDRNPAPYSFVVNLDEDEWLVGASPEMYVRVTGERCETCPISGTIKRGVDAIGDELNIRELLNSKKDESELTMCTDVDRNDKSRICRPGSVKVLARRQIEKYSRLIHTVDHVEGHLREGFDALDAFLCHTWAVTVTGSPKAWAMQFVEDQEESARSWYAGAVGALFFNRDMDTGLTLRTIRLKDGVASVRAGATLLWDSDPDSEEAETRLKASAFLDAITTVSEPLSPTAVATQKTDVGTALHIVIVDHQDSFVHTVGNYLRQTGARVTTVRAGFPESVLDELDPDMVVMSPGPGCPSDFKCSETLQVLERRGLPVFGVCLG